MMKRFNALMLALLLVFCCAAALAQTAECPAGGFSVWVPDHFEEVQIDPLFGPDLCFYWHGKKLAIQAYNSAQAGSDLFQVLTGREKEYGSVTVNGMDMLYALTEEFGNVCISYTWMNEALGCSISLEFTYSAKDRDDVQKTVDKVIQSISFDSGY